MRTGRSPAQRRRGFSMLELMVTVVLLGILTGVGAFAFTRTNDTAAARADELYLSTVRLAAHNLTVSDQNQFPEGLPDVLSANAPSGTTVTTGASTGPSVISVHRVSGTTLVLADLDATHSICTILVDDLTTAAVWGEGTASSGGGLPAGSCSGANASAVATSITSSDASSPTPVTMPGT